MIESVEKPKYNLPAQQTAFIGRSDELEEIQQMLSKPDCRLLSLIGPGGIGKTRLALQAAVHYHVDYKHGTCFIPLAPITSSDQIVPTIADALEFTFDIHTSDLDPKSQLLDLLRGKSILMILDNFEHLIEGADLLGEILDNAPDLTLLVTSRERLNLQREWTFNVPEMHYPKNGDSVDVEEYSALTLFLERARHAHSKFRLTADNTPAIVRICQLVSGIPLGIELAAAWTASLPCSEIADEIENNLDFLSTSMRDAPVKHRSMRAVFNHSWDLLSEDLQTGFCKLSVFQGGFTREAAEQVADIDLTKLSEFVNKSLIRRTETNRYEIHELLRQYANEVLKAYEKAEATIREDHSRYFIEVLAENLATLKKEILIETKEEIRLEIENIRTAVNWAVSHWEAKQARDMLILLNTFYLIYSWHEGQDVFSNITRLIHERRKDTDIPGLQGGSVYLSARIFEANINTALGRHTTSETIVKECMPAIEKSDMPVELGTGHFCLGVNAIARGEYETSKPHLREAIEIGTQVEKFTLVAVSHLYYGWLLYLLGDNEGARTHFLESDRFYIQDGNQWGRPFVLSKLGLIEDSMGDYEQAMHFHEQARDTHLASNDKAGVAYSNSRMSMSAYGMERYEDALKLAKVGHEVFDEIGHRAGTTMSLCRIGFAAIGLGELSTAEDHFRQAIERSLEYESPAYLYYALAGFASIYAIEGKNDKAVELYTFVKEDPISPQVYKVLMERWFTEFLDDMPQDERQAAEEQGRKLTLEEAIARFRS